MQLSYLTKLIFVTYCGLFSIIGSIQAEKSPVFIENIDFRRIQSQLVDTDNELDKLQQIADIEFFYWFGCEACLQVEVALSEYLKLKQKLRIHRIPLVAHLHWREQAYIQPLLEQMKPQMEAVPDYLDIYRTCLTDCQVFASFELTKQWLTEKYQLEQFPKIDEVKLWKTEKEYESRAETFSISQVPTIIIRETFVVDANSAKSSQRLIQIIDYLLNQESH